MDLRLSALIGAVGVIAFPSEPQFYVLCAVVVSTIGTIINQQIKGKQEQRRRDAEDLRYERDRAERLAHHQESQRQYERTAELTISKAAEVKQEVGVAAAEVKREVNVAQALTAVAARELKTELNVNTNLTRAAVQRADRASVAAAQTDEKLEKLVAPVAQDTNDVVHRIEDGKRGE